MRPFLVVPGTLIMVAVLAVAYFAGGQAISSGTLSRDAPVTVPVPPAGMNLLGGTPLTVTYTGLPAGASIFAVVCSSSTASTCASSSLMASEPVIELNRSSGTFTFQLNSGQTVVLLATVGGVQYQATSPLWSLYSTVFLVLLIIGFVVAVVGIAMADATERAERPARSERTASPKPAAPRAPQRRSSNYDAPQWPPPSDAEWPPEHDPNPPAGEGWQ